MTTVAVVNAQVPFIRGGAEILSDSLVRQLRLRGFHATAINIPVAWNPPEVILDHILAARLLRIGNIDRLIPLKFPAFHIPHDNKVLWLLHQFRQAYDLWGTALQGISDDRHGHQIRDAIRRADDEYLPEAQRIYTNSPVTRDRLQTFNGIAAEVLYPPLPTPELFHQREPEGFLFMPSRLSSAKRQLLAVEAMAHVTTPVRLIVAGPPDSPGDLDALERMVEEHALQDVVDIRPGWMTDEDKADLLARCRACVYMPFDEDSYGYVTLEAYASGKPVITSTDSGTGVRALVIDEETGWVREPEPEAVADAFDCAYREAAVVHDMGRAGQEKVEELNISWDHVINELTR